MAEWHRRMQQMIDRIDDCIRQNDDEALSLGRLSRELGYSELYFKKVRGDLRYAVQTVTYLELEDVAWDNQRGT